MSTTLPHGIIQINEGNISWYGGITANWQLIDSKIGVYDAAIASIPAPANNGTLTINYGGTTIAMFGADNAGNVSADIPTPGDGTLTVTQGGSTLGSFTANQAAAGTIDIPAPGDGTLTIAVNGTPAGTFTANQSTAATANITVPTAVSELTNDSGYLTSSSNLDASKLTSGTVDIERLPQGALERLVKVANEAARYALTTADVQLGDTVQQLDTGIMYVVTDTDHLDSAAGYTEYTAGAAASVPWSGVTGKPTIPTVNDATLTIQQNGTTVKTFTANASSNVTANITVPTNTNQLTNGAGFITSSGSCASCTTAGQVSTSVANGSSKDLVYAFMAGSDAFRIKCGGEDDDGWVEIATSDNGNEPIYVRQYSRDDGNIGEFNKIVRTLTLLDGNGNTQFPGTVTAPTFSGNLTGNCSGSAGSVAWSNVSGRPTIPTVNDATLTIQKNGTTVKTFTANASSNVTANITVPTKTSELTNDSGFITSDNTKIPLSGSNAISGSLIPSTDNSIDIGSSTKNIKMFYTKGITINGTQFLPSDYVPRIGGSVMTGSELGRTVSNNILRICGGTGSSDGGYIQFNGANNETSGIIRMVPLGLNAVYKEMIFQPDGTWTWTGTACQLVSDQRLKQQIAEIDDKLLDAWEDVNLVQFKYNDAVKEKSDNARLHTGYVVQQIDSACKSHGVDVSAYGLYCHEEYPQETEEIEVEQADGTKTKERKVIREANEHYSLRYTEVYAVECMYLRRCIKQLTARIEQLEKGKEQEAGK